MKSFALIALTTLLGSAVATAIPANSVHFEEPFNVTLTKVDIGHASDLEARHLETRQGGCTWQAFSGNTCNGGAGAVTDVPPAGRCNDARGRHSYFFTSGCGNLRITINDDVNCGGNAVTVVQGPGCYNVNTGRNWQSSFVSHAN